MRGEIFKGYHIVGEADAEKTGGWRPHAKIYPDNKAETPTVLTGRHLLRTESHAEQLAIRMAKAWVNRHLGKDSAH
jgi:hypothetical protein